MCEVPSQPKLGDTAPNVLEEAFGRDGLHPGNVGERDALEPAILVAVYLDPAAAASGNVGSEAIQLRGETKTMFNWREVLTCSVSLAVAFAVGACAKGGQQDEDQALAAAAATAIEATLKKPDAAYCDIKVGEGFTSRNDADLMAISKLRVELFCRQPDAPPAAHSCWSALQAQKAGATRDKSFPECLTMYDGSINRSDGKTSGLRFRCGDLSKVSVKKVEKLEPTRVRVTYVLDAKRETVKVNAIERACGEVTSVPSEETTALLLKDGDRWTLAGH